MRFFFRSRQFKIILAVTVALIAVSVTFAVIGGRMSPQSDIVGSITAPFRSFATKISGYAKDFVSAYSDGEKMLTSNAELENELNDLRKKTAEYEKIKAENDFYKNYLGIKDENPDFKLTSAILISRDKDDPYKSFTINKGTLNGISAYDPVITDAGVVGYISKAGLTTAKVSTVLSPEVTLGAFDNRTSDSGVVSGSMDFAKNNETCFRNLSRSCTIAVGDYVITSGEGIFPSGLLLGTIISIGSDKYNTSIFAGLKPFVDIDDIKNVMVITEFDGQGGLKP